MGRKKLRHNSEFFIIFDPAMDYKNYIERRPQLNTGKQLIHSTRLSTVLIKRKIEDGDTMERVKASYPHLCQSQFDVVSEFAEESSLV